MVLLSMGLMALGLVGGVVATPVMAEPLFTRDLAVRQTDKCPTNGYKSNNGLNFTTYCDQNNPQNDAIPAFQSSSMQDCMEHCSRFWGTGEGCFGIVWVEKRSECWIRTSNVTIAGNSPAEGHYSALVNRDGMVGVSTACPATDGSSHTLSGIDGMGYTVNCGKVIDGFDACFDGYGDCWSMPFKGYFHTDSLEDCLRICMDQHPLCKAVSWNPGLEIGFANCWPKTDFSSSKLINPRSNMGVLHSATVTSIDRIDTTCPDKAFTAQNKKIFDVHCGQLNAGSNITHIHTQNVTSCMEACSISNDGCIGVVFDSTLQFGFENCALQKTTNVITSQPYATFAALSSATATSGSSGSSSSGTPSTSSSSSSSKAWIAGPVIGGVTAIAIIAFITLRRRKVKKALYAEKNTQVVDPAYAVAPAYSSPGAPHGHALPPQHQQQHQYYDTAAAQEMSEERERNELPATTKYAYRGAAPQELPS